MHVINQQFMFQTIKGTAILGIDFIRLFTNFGNPPRAGDGQLDHIE